MIFTLYVQRDKYGHLIKKPKGVEVLLDIDKNRVATVFEGERLVGELRVLEFEAHAAGLFLRGVVSERLSVGEKSSYQEWFLSYAREEAAAPGLFSGSGEQKGAVSGQGNCSECGALAEHLYSLRCPACYDKLVASGKKSQLAGGQPLFVTTISPITACGHPRRDQANPTNAMFCGKCRGGPA